MRCSSSTSLMPCTTSGGLAAISSAGRVGGGQAGVGVGIDVVDQTDLLGANRVNVLARQRKFSQMPVGQDQRQTSQATDIGDDRQLDLTYRELGIGAGVSDVDRGDQIDRRRRCTSRGPRRSPESGNPRPR